MWLIAVLVVAGACNKKPELAVVQRVVLSLPNSIDADAKTRERIRSDVKNELQKDDLTLVTDDDSKATHLVRVEVAGVLDPVAREERPGVIVQLRSFSKGAILEAVGHSKNEDRAEFVVDGFSDAWSIITTRRLLQVAPERDILASLQSSDLRVRAAAISLLGERKIGAGVEPLCDILANEENELLVLRAVGALIALGDPAAIDPLIELARNKDPRFVLQVVFAVGAIGGQTARGYLVTLASGHPVESVRRGAQDALEELERRSER
ncbi:MAG: HEAT repeat domain-containing protein [Myxococcota bacterium]